MLTVSQLDPRPLMMTPLPRMSGGASEVRFAMSKVPPGMLYSTSTYSSLSSVTLNSIPSPLPVPLGSAQPIAARPPLDLVVRQGHERGVDAVGDGEREPADADVGHEHVVGAPESQAAEVLVDGGQIATGPVVVHLLAAVRQLDLLLLLLDGVDDVREIDRARGVAHCRTPSFDIPVPFACGTEPFHGGYPNHCNHQRDIL